MYVCVYQSHAEFHHDLFPDTAGPSPAAATVDQWLAGSSAQRGKVSLDPAKQPKRDTGKPKPEKTVEKKENAEKKDNMNGVTKVGSKPSDAAVAKATTGGQPSGTKVR